ncbi:cupin domain-containing protein [Lacinutrix sp. C3R15]|uniref:cupin domain-containing protein n=1 Tax=Flavobacteriaceae TaxID=49546 RepID=UPI001C082C60|nr:MULTISPECIES: cupin domain-containing protein [Flavobacteriaceae]MBU2938377.1 cupin domain-containing protein [Lacinutrix sp. C3R15]MDO6621692.1 cupin domain-containing protein [Oceanihabitans sp. 1_MG-2023]
MPQKNKYFDWLIHPIAKETFLSNYFEKEVLHIKQDKSRTSSYYNQLLTRNVFDLFLNEQNVKYPDVQLVGTSIDFKHREYLHPDNSINLPKLYKFYAEGATINVVGLNNYLMSLGELCDHLTKETSHRYQTNIYCTPKEKQGFNTHYDSHDVIVLQIHGSKEWEIYDNPVELPLKGPQNFTPEMDLTPTLKQNITLKEGELLYIPRGVMHNAKTTDTSSIHITLGLMGTSMFKLVSNSIANAATNNVEFRKYLPFGYINDKQLKDEIIQSYKKLIGQLENDIDLNTIINDMEDEVIKQVPSKLVGQLELIDGLNENKIDYYNSTFSLRKNILIKYEVVDEELIIKANGLEHSFPDYVYNTFHIMYTKDRFNFKELETDLDDEGKEVLLEHLITEGLVFTL